MVSLLCAAGALSACSSKQAAPPPPTIPIATEAPVTTLPAPATTVAAPTTAPAVTTTTKYDYAKIPVLVKFTPKNTGEQELVDEMKRLLVIEKERVSDPSIPET